MPPREPRHRGRAGLTRRMRLAMVAVGSALFTREDGPPPAARVEWLADEIHDFFAHAGTRARWTIRVCLLAISVLAPLYVRRLPPFRALPHELRVPALERLERSAFGLAVLGVKAIACIIWYEHPDSLREIAADQRCRLPLAAPGAEAAE